MHSHCLSCPLSLEQKKQRWLACCTLISLADLSTITETESMFSFLCNQHCWPFLASNSSAFYTLKDGGFTYALEQGVGSAEGVCEEIAASWSVADLFLTPELLNSCMAIIHLPINHRIVTLSQKSLSLLENCRRSFWEENNTGTEQNLNEYWCLKQSVAIGFLQTLIKILSVLDIQRLPWLHAENCLGAHSKVRVPPTEPACSFPQKGELATEISLCANPSTPTLVIYEV